MVALQIRDVPADVRDALAAQARLKGWSLQTYLLDVITMHAHRSANQAVLERFARRSDGTRAVPGEAAAAVAEERDSR